MSIAGLSTIDRDARIRPLRGGLAGDTARPSAVIARHAVEFMQQHLDQAISIGSISAAVGAGPRTLHRAFARERGMTPMQFLRRARLDRVRADLLAAGHADRVASIAVKWGFTHLGRFSRAYRQTFGEMPSATRRRRASGGTPVAEQTPPPA